MTTLPPAVGSEAIGWDGTGSEALADEVAGDDTGVEQAAVSMAITANGSVKERTRLGKGLLLQACGMGIGAELGFTVCANDIRLLLRIPTLEVRNRRLRRIEASNGQFA